MAQARSELTTFTSMWLVLLLVIGLGAVVYAPGLSGDFVFDDYTNILENSALRPEALSLDTLLAAAVSSESGPLKRPLASLSFLANFHFFGSDPFSFKVTNLAVHLLNGCLVYWLLCSLLPRLLKSEVNSLAIAGLIAIIWTVHPINLTSVLYTVQRMTSLAATFTLLAMICYVRLRRCVPAKSSSHNRVLWMAVMVFGLLGILTKECALLLPGFLALIELTTFRFRDAGYLKWLFAAGAMLAGAGLWYIFGPLDHWGEYYRTNSFTASQRLLTELRVLMFYLGQLLIPDPTRMTLLHVDWQLSKSLLEPWTTGAAAGFFSLAIAFGFVVQGRHPIYLFSIGWYLIGHLLESTIIPLELVFEHRNYLPSLGIFCLVGAAIAHVAAAAPMVGRLLAGGLIIILSAMTAYRAWQWSDPFTLALTEARHNPTSARARYEYGRRYFQLYLRERKPEMLATARQELWAAVEHGSEDFFPLVGLVNTYVGSREPVPENLMHIFETELREEQPTERRLDAVHLVLSCQIKRECPSAPDVVRRSVSATLANARVDIASRAKLLEWLAVYYANVMGDLAAARSVINAAVETQPDDWTYRLRLLEITVLQQDWSAARSELARLQPEFTHWTRVAEPTLAKRFDALRAQLADHNQALRNVQ